MRRLKFRREDGVAMTEFALILPIFMVIVAGMLGFGRVFFYWIQANHVANETARWAIVDRNPYAPTTLQQARCETARAPSSTRIRRVCITRFGDKNLGAPLKVTVAKPFTFVPDPRHRQDHDPSLLDDADRAPGRPEDAVTGVPKPQSYTEACGT